MLCLMVSKKSISMFEPWRFFFKQLVLRMTSQNVGIDLYKSPSRFPMCLEAPYSSTEVPSSSPVAAVSSLVIGSLDHN